jgi:hypothetical protein
MHTLFIAPVLGDLNSPATAIVHNQATANDLGQ